MVTVFIDTAVVMYANGTSHPLRDACRSVMIQVANRQLEATTSSEVVQEIVHRFVSLKRPEIGIAMAQLTMDVFAPVLPITHALMRRVPELAARYPTLSARDLVHVATCIHEGIDEIITPDRGFDQVVELRRIDPMSFAELPA